MVIKPSYKTHTLSTIDKVEYVFEQGFLTTTPAKRMMSLYGLISYSLDGCWSLYPGIYAGWQYITFVYPVKYDEIPLVYLLREYVKEHCDGSIITSVPLVWETEVAYKKEVNIADCDYVVIGGGITRYHRRKEKYVKLLKEYGIEIRDSFPITALNATITEQIKPMHDKHYSDVVVFKSYMKFVDMYNRSICELYKKDYKRLLDRAVRLLVEMESPDHFLEEVLSFYRW